MPLASKQFPLVIAFPGEAALPGGFSFFGGSSVRCPVRLISSDPQSVLLRLRLWQTLTTRSIRAPDSVSVKSNVAVPIMKKRVSKTGRRIFTPKRWQIDGLAQSKRQRIR